MLITITPTDLAIDPIPQLTEGNGYTWDRVNNPVSQAIMRSIPGTSAFITAIQINVFREQNYWFDLPKEIAELLTKHAQLAWIKHMVSPGDKEIKLAEKLEKELNPLIPVSFELLLPELTQDQIDAAKLAKVEFVEWLEGLREEML